MAEFDVRRIHQGIGARLDLRGPTVAIVGSRSTSRDHLAARILVRGDEQLHAFATSTFTLFAIGDADDGDGHGEDSEDEEELELAWSYVQGMLKNFPALSLSRIFGMLQMFVDGGFDGSEDELRKYLDGKVAAGELATAGGEYKLPPPS